MTKNLVFFATMLFIGTTTTHSAFATTVNPITPAIIIPGNPSPSDVKGAKEAFKNLSLKEKKKRFKDVKAAIGHYKADRKAGKEPSTNTLLLVILAILLPPLAVYLHEGVINSKFWIDLILTLLFYVPGLIYALIVVLGKS